MKRRDFLKTSALAAVGLGFAPFETSCAQGYKTDRVHYTEGGSVDIIVAGGGPAGIAAAITAARLGKKVLILEAGGCLGGIWTRSTLSCVMDFGRADIAKEIIARLDAMDARTARWAKLGTDHFIFEPEVMKLILEQMCDEAGVRYIFNCPVVAVEKDLNGRNIKAVYTESKSGRQRWTAEVFFDTTGDGDLAAKAGCGYDFGGENPGDNDQPASIHAIAMIDDDTRVAEFINNDPTTFAPNGHQLYNTKSHFRDYAHNCGAEAAAPCLVRIRKNLLALYCGFEYGIRVDDAEGITKAMVHARREMFSLVDALKKNGGDRWDGLRIVATSDQLGQRASRRVHGRYTVSNDDIVNGATFEDAVAWSKTYIDVHTTKPGEAYILDVGIKSKPFQIPFRACQAKDVDNLYMSGKCISGSFYALASYRMTGNAVEMGENVARKVCDLM